MSCLATLKARGYRVTSQRKVILEVLHREGKHLTAEDIMVKVCAQSPRINRSTIYRTLDFLEGLGLVVRSELAGKLVYHHAEEGHHHHLVCRQCGRVTKCSEKILKPLESSLLSRHGFIPDLHHLLITGVCRNCR
jgi:Fur family transcriptional regulator, ferric uptake regulator